MSTRTQAVISRPPGSQKRSALYFSNPASADARVNLTVRRSDDGGETWAAALTIQKGESAGYSSLPQRTLITNDALSGILYEATDPGCIDFAPFPLDF